MDTVKYFSGTQEVQRWDSMKNEAFAALFPGVKGIRMDGYQKLIGKDNGEVVPVTRVIYRKSNPSNHKCDARCRHAKGGNCECSCGGQFHGAGG